MCRKGIWMVLIVVLAALAPAAWAESHEEAPVAPSFMYVWTDHVPLAHAQEYETATRGVLAEMAATAEGKKLRYFALSTRGAYIYVIPMASLAEFPQKNQEFLAATNAVGGMKVWDPAQRLVNHGSGQLIVSRPDLGYEPAAPREPEKTGMFRHHEWWYVRPGNEMEFEAVAKKFAELYAEEEIDTGFRIYQAVTGDDLPLYLVTFSGTDAADHYANEARIDQLLGEAAQKLIQEAVGLARRVETTTAMMRSDLSMGM